MTVILIAIINRFATVQYQAGGRQRDVTRPKPEDGNGEVFTEALRRERNTLGLNGEELVAVISRACDASMPRKTSPRENRSPVYWWCESIANLRAICLRARRRMQRARTEAQIEERGAAFRETKLTLKKEIKSRKRACFDSLCQLFVRNRRHFFSFIYRIRPWAWGMG